MCANDAIISWHRLRGEINKYVKAKSARVQYAITYVFISKSNKCSITVNYEKSAKAFSISISKSRQLIYLNIANNIYICHNAAKPEYIITNPACINVISKSIWCVYLSEVFYMNIKCSILEALPLGWMKSNISACAYKQLRNLFILAGVLSEMFRRLAAKKCSK